MTIDMTQYCGDDYDRMESYRTFRRGEVLI